MAENEKTESIKMTSGHTFIILPQNGRAYLNESIRNAGYVGHAEYFLGVVTLIIIKPDADPEDVIQGLNQTIETIKMRQKYAGRVTG